MTPGEVMQLEALRTTAMAAFTSARAVVQTIDALLVASDQSDPAPDAAWDSFDSEPTTPNEAINGHRQARKRR